MPGVVFAIVCWLVWYLSPQDISLLAFDRGAIAGGEWWRLWTAHFTHFKYSQLILNSSVIALMGLVMMSFVSWRNILISLLVAMPLVTGAVLVVEPGLMAYRGASGIAAMMVMMAVWFLILESKRFSLGYWLGMMLLLLFVAKLGLEYLMMYSLSGHRFAGWSVDWLVQCFGVMLGLALFNALHQIYVTKTARNKQYRGASRPRGR